MIKKSYLVICKALSVLIFMNTFFPTSLLCYLRSSMCLAVCWLSLYPLSKVKERLWTKMAFTDAINDLPDTDRTNQPLKLCPAMWVEFFVGILQVLQCGSSWLIISVCVCVCLWFWNSRKKWRVDFWEQWETQQERGKEWRESLSSCEDYDTWKPEYFSSIKSRMREGAFN